MRVFDEVWRLPPARWHERDGAPVSDLDFISTSVTDLAAMVQRKEVSARELAQHALDRIDALNGRVGAFVEVDAERALRDAAQIDETGHPGPLAGIPIGVKDLEDADGFRTTKGSPLFAQSPRATTDSELVRRLKGAGCVVVGKTNTPEFGHKADTRNLVFPPTVNPWDLERGAGGSSGGSSAAIAAGMVPLCTGSDGGGSIRIPSAACGLSGLKPSLGRVPSGGSEPPDWVDLSTKGPMARRIADVALALDCVIGPDATDIRSLPMPEASWSGAVLDPSPPLRVGWSPTLGYGTNDPEVLAACEAAVRTLESMGAEVVEIPTVFDTDPAISWATLVAAYLVRTVTRAGCTDWSQVDPSLRMFLELGTSTTPAFMVESEDACHRLNLRLVEVFAGVSVLLTPTTAGITPPAGDTANPNWVSYTYPFNMTRSPAGTVCAGVSSGGVPIGLQVVGPQHGDQVVLRTIAALEEALGQPEPPRL
jgi:aspartyl-tRNA(Asn)/glutamyl-tRNA(Gln) amidotransferase subunit A